MKIMWPWRKRGQESAPPQRTPGIVEAEKAFKSAKEQNEYAQRLADEVSTLAARLSYLRAENRFAERLTEALKRRA